MTALAESLTAQQDRGAGRGRGGAGAGPVAVPGPALPADRPEAARDHSRAVRSWPLLLLAFPAAEVWSGWVGIAQKTGFDRSPRCPASGPRSQLTWLQNNPICVPQPICTSNQIPDQNGGSRAPYLGPGRHHP